MPLTPGTQLGPYEVLSAIGSGGMGDVYRARDTKLQRDVALKVLPDLFAHDPERLARFQREAQVLASLNHPNIAQIYGLEESNGVRALVMEFVQGPTLGEVIARTHPSAVGVTPERHGAKVSASGTGDPRGLEVADALSIARQIAEALEAAHEQGIIHRDLKPANVKIRSDGMVKVLDFGLAKALAAGGPGRAGEPGGAGGLTNAPTLSSPALMTGTGMILGTAAYMSPEQARGSAADRRADLWAFGCVLWEMLTGACLFGGATVSDTLASVLKTDPDWNALPPDTPAAIRKLLRRCLEKDRRQRLDSAADARLEIEEAQSTKPEDLASAPVPVLLHRRADRYAWIAAGLFAIVAGAALWAPWRATKQEERPLIRYNVDLGPEAVAGPAVTVVVSPDGRRLVYPVRGANGTTALATRVLDQGTATMLRGTEGAVAPFFSPDGQWVGFFAGSKLKKVSVAGGAPVILCDAPDFYGASWGSDGHIIAALNTLGGLSRVPADGGLPQALTKPDQGALTHRWPQILPRGRFVVFTAGSGPGNFDRASIELLALATGRTTTLVRGGYFGRYVASAPSAGHLLYLREGTLYAAAFDPNDARLRGQAIPVLEDVAGNPSRGSGQFDVSESGAVYYQTGAAASSDLYPVLWLDRAGKTTPLLAKPETYSWPRLSPDGSRLALTLDSEGRADVLVYDWQRDRLSRLDSSGRVTHFPVWAPDGKHLVVQSQSSQTSSEGSALVWMNADGGEATPLVSTKGSIYPSSFSSDGKRLAYVEIDAQTRDDIWILPLDTADPNRPKPGQSEAFLRTPSRELFPAFSPDGRWIAYNSDESGRFGLYVRPVGGDSAGAGAKWQISNGAGFSPVWSRDGRQLYFLSPPANLSSAPSSDLSLDGRLTSVDIAVRDGALVTGTPRVWADVSLRSPRLSPSFDLHPDGQRVAVFPGKAAGAEPGPSGSVHATVLFNFFDELRRRVPVGKR